MTEELPEGWALTTLGEVTEPKVEQTTPSGTSHFTYIDIAGISNTRKVIADVKLIPAKDAPSRARQHIEPGDVLVSMTRPNLNAVAIVPEPLHGSIASTGFHVLRPKNTLPEWVFSLVRSTSFVAAMSELVQGALYPAVRPSDIRDFQIPLPPLPEQRRIVAKIEELTARSRAAREALADMPAMLEQFRQSVLASAFRGDLTADWRANRPDTEPASELLARIRLERRTQWEAKYPKKKYVEPDPVDETDLPELPAAWAWTVLDELAEVQLGQRKAPEYVGEKEYHYIRSANITWDGLDLTDVKAMGFADAIPLKLEKGDILLNEASGSPTEVGKPALWQGEIPDCCFQATVIRLRSYSSEVSPFWLFFNRLRDALLGEYAARCPGLGIIHLTSTLLKTWPVPLAPLEEQHEIVRRLEVAEGKRRATLASVIHVLGEVDRLEQSILAKAFRGELVPQDPTDEPASVLLERLRSGHSEPKAPTAITRGRLSRIALLLLHHWNNAASRELVDRGMLLMLDDDLRKRLVSGGTKPKRKKRGTPTPGTPISFPHLLGAMIDAGYVTAKIKGSFQTLLANPEVAKKAHASADAADLARLRETMKVMELIEEKQLDAELAEAFRGQEIAITV